MADIKSNIETRIPLEGDHESLEALEADEAASKDVLQSPESTDQTTEKIRVELGKSDEEVVAPMTVEEVAEPTIEGVSALGEAETLKAKQSMLMDILHGKDLSDPEDAMKRVLSASEKE